MQKRLPGPGFYKTVEYIGNVIPDSSVKTERQNVFKRADDRFLKVGIVSPNPAYY